jgi:TupA-like ATPgrasp
MEIETSPLSGTATRASVFRTTFFTRTQRFIKRLVHSRPLLKLGRIAGWLLPDRQYLAIGHLIYFRRWPDFDAPRNFNEHIQAYMLRCRDPVLRIAADKYAIRQFVTEQVGEQYLVPCLGVWDDADQVPLNALPMPYVLKATAGSGMVMFISSARDLDIPYLRATMRKWLKYDYSRLHREWCYKGIRQQIIAEAKLSDETGGIPADYKVYVIGGGVRFIQIDRGRFDTHTRNLYSTDWELLPARLTLQNHAPDERPACLEEMIVVALKLSQPFEFLRVDFYVIGLQLYVGELTNYPGAGFEKFFPASFSTQLGAYWRAAAAPID